MWLLVVGLVVFAPQQTEWTNGDIDEVVLLMKAEGAEKAKALADEKGTTLYDLGRKILERKGINEALFWYKELAEAFQDPQYLYGMARAHWRARAIDHTRTLCLEIMEMDPSELLKARTYYMMGRVEAYSRNPKTATANFKKSFDLYDALGKNGGRYLACYGIADVLIKEKNLGAAREYIERARNFNAELSNPYPSAHLDELEGEISFELRNYEMAFDWYEKARISYGEEQDMPNKTNVMVKLGLCQVLLGRFEEGYHTAEKVDGLVHQYNLIETYHFNNLVWMLIYRCGNQFNEYNKIKQGFLHHVEKGPRNTSLLEAMKFLESLPCPEEIP